MITINSCPTQAYRQRRDQRGQSAVEIALLLPLLLLLLFGIIMVGFIFYASIQVTNASREGARAGSVYLSTMNNVPVVSLDQTVKNAIYDPLAPAGLRSALGFLAPTGSSFNVNTDVVCTLNGAACSTFTQSNPPRPGDQLVVIVTYRYSVPVISVMLPMFPQPIAFAPRVTMEVQ